MFSVALLEGWVTSLRLREAEDRGQHPSITSWSRTQQLSNTERLAHFVGEGGSASSGSERVIGNIFYFPSQDLNAGPGGR